MSRNTPLGRASILLKSRLDERTRSAEPARWYWACLEGLNGSYGELTALADLIARAEEATDTEIGVEQMRGPQLGCAEDSAQRARQEFGGHGRPRVSVLGGLAG